MFYRNCTGVLIVICGLGPLIALGISLSVGKFGPGATLGERIRAIAAFLFVLYGASVVVFIVLGLLCGLLGAGPMTAGQSGG